MKKLSFSLFIAVVFIFSAFITVLSLLASIRLNALGDSAGRLSRMAEELEKENRQLAAQAEAVMSLEELERYAIEVLGMQHCKSEQIIYINVPKGEDVVIG